MDNSNEIKEPNVSKEEIETQKRQLVICPRCGTYHWLLPGQTVYCKGKTNNPYAHHGICCLWIGLVEQPEKINGEH